MIDISKQIKPVFEVLPDFEYSADSEENIIYISHLHLLLKRL